MSSTTLTNLRLRSLERAGMLVAGGAASSFVSTAELDAIINGQCAELHDIRIAAYTDELTINSTFALATAVNTYVPGLAVYELRGVDIQQGPDWFPLTKFAWNERGAMISQLNYNTRAWPRFRWTGDTIYFDRQDASGTYRLWYIPAFVDLVADGDTLVAPQRWDEFVIAGTAAWLLAKEESDASVQLGLKAQLKARIEGMAPNRDATGPETIERTRRRGHRDDDDDGSWQRPR